MYTTSLEKVLAESLARCTGADIPGIIAAAQECCKGGSASVTEVVVSPTATPTITKKAAAAIRASIKEREKPITPAGDTCAPEKPAETVGKPVEATTPTPTPAPVAEKPATPAPTVGIDLSGLFVGTGADKKVVKTVFLAAVDSAKTLAHLVALNATCDCGFATGDYTEETAAVLKRKLARWGAAQE